MPDYATFDSWLGGILPGGVAPGTGPSGRALFGAGTDAPAGVGQLGAVTALPRQVSRYQAPPGYVLVSQGEGRPPVAVLAKVAYALGLKKRPQRGGGLTRREISAARHVQSVIMSLTTTRKPKLALKKGRR
jgi:hypothetical protein